MRYFLFAFCLLGTLLAESPLGRQAKYLRYITEKPPTAQEYYGKMMEQMKAEKWRGVLNQADALVINYPDSPFAAEACYYKGYTYFQLGELEQANEAFSDYLSNFSQVKYFEEAFSFKYQVACSFADGAKKRILGSKHTPKILSAKEDAIDIFDEVITALPRHELAAQSLFKKAMLLTEFQEYKDGIESFQTLIRRFPKHELAPESYLAITRTYLDQCKNHYPDPDFIELAQINLRKFERDFPLDERVQMSKKVLLELKEAFAEELYETAKYFKRKKKPDATRIYLETMMKRYGDTDVAKKAQKEFAL